MPAAATHTDLSRMKPVGFLKNPSELLEKEKNSCWRFGMRAE